MATTIAGAAVKENSDFVNGLVSSGVQLAMQRQAAGSATEHCAVDELLQALPEPHGAGWPFIAHQESWSLIECSSSLIKWP